MSFPRPENRLHVSTAARDPQARGRQRGEALRGILPGAIDAYDRLFAAGGLDAATVRSDAERALDAVAAHRGGLAEQIAGVAAGAGVDPWRVAALNARTEILARSRAVPPGECSTVVRSLPDAAVAGATRNVGVQTWDWHAELSDYWHTLDADGGAHRYAGITEDGILAKIGVNGAGVALHFNILGHTLDGVGGIPMHVLAALVLEEAEDAAHAVELVREAPIASSGSFLVFDRDRAVLLDLSPVGVFEAPAVLPGIRVRTNHFLTAEPAAAEKTTYQPDSGERYGFLVDRLTASLPETPEAMLAELITGEGEPALTCLPAPDARLGERWASLATVILDPAHREARVLDGTPAEHAVRPWHVLHAR
ncbi:C45 family autoproteolytic acyltransferase/hydolase [Microbacterium mangrovi]|uniref:C45 family autoproteolytic acyltransferase/hydolase n=1 Tax=Microbacterium mangrovi TaxID=1348253 RepID=UPI00068D6133|nr:C45 family peptidase [Microbacterium mangrovi]